MLTEKIELQMEKGNYTCVCMYVLITSDSCDIYLHNSIHVGDIKNVKNEICIDHYNYFSQDLINFITMNVTLPLFSKLHLAQGENRNFIHISVIYLFHVTCIYLLQSQGKRMQKGSKDVWADFKEKVSFSAEIQKYMFKQ